jgi:hypothetical protein
MSIQFDQIDTDFIHSPRPQPASTGWTRIPPSTGVWRITRDTEVQFADGAIALWAVDPTIGFHEIDLSVLKDRPVRMRQAAVTEPRTRTRDFLPF